MSRRARTSADEGRMTQAERSALSDRRMFDAAIELINERGTQKTTLKEIGERAGYSRGLANYRFGSKDGLMLELLQRFDGRWAAHLDTYVGDATGLDAISRASRALCDFLGRETRYMRAMYLLWYECLGQTSDMRRLLAEHHEIYRRDAQRWVEQGQARDEILAEVDAAQFSAQFCAFIFGTVYQWLVDASALDLEAVFDDYIENTMTLLSNPDYSEEAAS